MTGIRLVVKLLTVRQLLMMAHFPKAALIKDDLIFRISNPAPRCAITIAVRPYALTRLLYIKKYSALIFSGSERLFISTVFVFLYPPRKLPDLIVSIFGISSIS